MFHPKGNSSSPFYPETFGHIQQIYLANDWEFHFVLMPNVKISADNDISFYHWHFRIYPECLQKLLGLRSVIELTVMLYMSRDEDERHGV